jgi:hypothetical protein
MLFVGAFVALAVVVLFVGVAGATGVNAVHPRQELTRQGPLHQDDTGQADREHIPTSTVPTSTVPTGTGRPGVPTGMFPVEVGDYGPPLATWVEGTPTEAWPTTTSRTVCSVGGGTGIPTGMLPCVVVTPSTVWRPPLDALPVTGGSLRLWLLGGILLGTGSALLLSERR